MSLKRAIRNARRTSNYGIGLLPHDHELEWPNPETEFTAQVRDTAEEAYRDALITGTGVMRKPRDGREA